MESPICFKILNQSVSFAIKGPVAVNKGLDVNIECVIINQVTASVVWRIDIYIKSNDPA